MSDDKDEKKEGMNWLVGLDKLFAPTFEYLGEELKDKVKDTLEEHKKKKRQENTAIHLAAVIERDPDNKVESVEQLELFSDWLDGAENISSSQ